MTIDMKKEYTTGRLQLIVSTPRLADPVSAYLMRNRDDFEHYDRHYGDVIYTDTYQRNALQIELDLYKTDSGVRYYIFKKEDPGTVIGNVSFAYLHDKIHAPSLGYKIDRMCRRRGYAYEAVSFLLPLVMDYYMLPFIEADALPENEASIALLKKLGFKYDGIIPNAHEIMGVMRDHYRFVFDPCS
ncbi:MAG: GNAT family N-acetyltransferase [Lachnospiraceae bacterium]|nr:GNAT family N-acetyltransferase [Lachnospiraceae bacterium]